MSQAMTWRGREYRILTRLVRVLVRNDGDMRELDDHDEAALEEFRDRIERRTIGWWVPADPRGDAKQGKCAVTGDVGMCEGAIYLIKQEGVA
jgi:hypothetical protein